MTDDPVESLRAYAFELAGMAKSGLEFVANEYDRDRYERTLRIAQAIASMTFPDGVPTDVAYVADLGIVTPKTGCSIAAFDEDGRVLLIRRADTGRWALPGGYAEINASPSENALRELREETGFDGELQRLLGVFDSRRFRARSPYQFYVLLFRARLVGGTAAPSAETTAVEFFSRDVLPADMSELQRAMVDVACEDPERPAFQ